MTNKIFKKDKINESHILPDPPGVKAIYANKNYGKQLNDIYTDVVEKAKVEALKQIADVLKKDWIGKLVSLNDESGRQKILDVSDIIVESKGGMSGLFLLEKNTSDDGKSADRKVKFAWEGGGGNIFDVGKFLEFFEEHYLDKYIQFTGKPIKGGSEARIRKVITQFGISIDSMRDSIIMEANDGVCYFLNHTQPIKLIDIKLKELDPYDEEDWEN